MSVAASRLTIPRAEALREQRAPRRGAGGRPIIGPKVQVHIPDEQYNAILDEMEVRGWGDEDYPDMLREVVAAGVVALGLLRGGA